MKITAPARSGPMRLIALLIADASPELRVGTELIRAVVSGATRIEMPSPKTNIAGRTSRRYPADGTRLVGSSARACQAELLDGIRASHSRPAAMSAGPTAMNQRGPRVPASRPKVVERK